MPEYSYYPTGNAEVIKQLNMSKHPEGGYFAETDRRPETVPSPFADNATRSLATSIFYLLTHEEPNGYIHMNKSVTYHVLHHGRAEYTLIHPGSPPRIEKKIVGTNAAAGELRQLLVGTGVWKMSRVLPEDRAAAKTDEEKDHVGCLITEVVVPGFAWEDHQYLTLDGLHKLFAGVEGAEEKIRVLSIFIRKN
ncbi:hypothetical protein GLOTRDRAFT_136190 [Gloeophyllum trabeum ATCC 11539]|uniref:DUF985 domain-containing protein n=1 Tax=Gloeophyllum trabeum (strain ATCC 11539 / FP-39264 / Madison 617) TaxID=670483 RepID=S7S0L3_GLOTA|nr:uncharacterized protein GLOTRDRAFT_136190 [Gloeophyllum trabeum ATCC 11539]EPQ59274.1 hypothetical protein GLOTRDRAFT_136190 [Gloeophyllum trabeum ATCC 11539]